MKKYKTLLSTLIITTTVLASHNTIITQKSLADDSGVYIKESELDNFLARKNFLTT